MKSKLQVHPVFILMGLFLFKIAIIDNIRTPNATDSRLAHHSTAVR